MFLVMKAYWPSVRKYWYWLVGTLIFLLLNVVCNTYRPFLYEALTGDFGAGFDENTAYRHLTQLALLLSTGWLMGRGLDWCLAYFELNVMYELDLRSFEKLQAQSMRFHESTHSGSLVKQANRFRDSLEVITDCLCYQLVRDTIMVSIAFGFFYWKQPMFAWMFLGWVGIFVALNCLFLWFKYPMDKKNADASSKISAVVADSLGAHATVVAYGHEDHEYGRLKAAAGTMKKLRLVSWTANVLFVGLQAALMIVFEIMAFRHLIACRKEGTVGTGEFVFFQASLATIFFLLWMFGHSLRVLFQHIAEAREMAEVFALEPEIKDVPNAHELTLTQGVISFEGVSFGYANNCRRELRDINLTIQPGQSVAIVGPSGAGKTTLLKALLQIFKLQSGKIVIDGQNIAEVTQRSLRRKFALVPQQADIFNNTVLENIRFARPDATDDEVIAALKAARLWDRIQELPLGLLTEVGERGMKLSGGERQRIAIARAFLANRPFLMLDEATSALDSKTEKLVQEALAELLKGRTSIAIAHRLSTIMNADVILVMEAGHIVQRGTHTELLAQGGLYAELWSHQSGGYLAE